MAIPGTDHCWNVLGIRGDGSCSRLPGHIHCRNCPEYSDAGRKLLDRPTPAGYLGEWERLLSEKKQAAGSNFVSAVVFRLGAEWLAIPVGIVREVTATLTVHSLPHRSSEHLLGITNVRGGLQLCVSLGALLGIEQDKGLPRSGRDAIPRFVVMERERERWVFRADEVHGAHRFGQGERRKPPVTISQTGTTFTKDMFLWDGRTVGLLDDELLFYALKRCLQ
jgi:chemotaxis-related protein WspD